MLAASLDPPDRSALLRLLDDGFPGFAERLRMAAGLGVDWHARSIPFTVWEGGEPVAHVGVLPTRWVAMGEAVEVAHVHAVCTRPDLRGRGLAGRALEAALAWCDERLPTQILFAAVPDLYRRFGFRCVAEHVFHTMVAGRAGLPPGRGMGMRRLRPDLAQDWAILERLLHSRTPVSDVLGAAPDNAMFTLNECETPLFYMSALDAVVVLELEGETLDLIDVVAPRIPTLDAILAAIPRVIERVRIHFAPDRLGVDAVAQPVLQAAALMVRGPFAVEAAAFQVPRPAR